MTLRVGEVGPGGAVVFRRERVVEVEPDPTVLREDACRFPPCACPRHRPDLHRAQAALRGLRAYGPVWAMVERRARDRY